MLDFLRELGIEETNLGASAGGFISISEELASVIGLSVHGVSLAHPKCSPRASLTRATSQPAAPKSQRSSHSNLLQGW